MTAVYGPPDPFKGVSYTWKKDHWYVAMTYRPQEKLTGVGVALSDCPELVQELKLGHR